MRSETVGLVRAIIVGALAVVALACGGAQPSAAAPASASTPAGAAKEPFDIEKAMAVEAEDLSERGIKSPDGAWSTTALSAGDATVEPVDQDVLVNIPVAANAVVSCRVFDDTVDAATTLSSFFQKVGSGLEIRQFALAPVRLHAGFPAASIAALYLSDVEGGKAVGRLHTALFAGEQRSVLCWLDDIGYAQTFARVTGALFANLRIAGAESAATYVEVCKTSLGEIDVGFSITTIEPSEQAGERIYSSVSSGFVPRSATDIMYEDTYVVLHVDAKNRMRQGTWVKSNSASELALQITLTRAKDGKLSYSGQVSGKPLNGTLSTPQGLSNSLEVAAMLKQKLAKGGVFSETVAEYHPSIDPTAPINVTYSRTKDAPARQVVMRLGERDFVGEVDEDGLLKSGRFDAGKHQILISRERVAGKL